MNIDFDKIKFKENEELESLMRDLKENHEDVLKEMMRSMDYNAKTMAEELDVDPRSLDALYTIGYQQFITENYKEAIQIFSSLTVMDHNNFRYKLALGGVYFRVGQYPAAQMQYGYIVAHDTKNLDAIYWLFRALSAQGEKGQKQAIKIGKGFLKVAESMEAESCRKYNQMYHEIKLFLKTNKHLEDSNE